MEYTTLNNGVKMPMAGIGTFLLTVSIILSTMFLKQHSGIDVVSAFLMAAILYFFVYAPRPIKSETYAKQTIG